MERSPRLGAFCCASLLDTVPAALANVKKLVVVIGSEVSTWPKPFLYKVNIVSYLLHLFSCVIESFSVVLRVSGLKQESKFLMLKSILDKQLRLKHHGSQAPTGQSASLQLVNSLTIARRFSGEISHFIVPNGL